MTPPRPSFTTPYDESPTLTYGPPDYRWWQWRKRRARLRLLERLAMVELHVSLNDETIVSTTFEAAYFLVKYGSGSGASIGVSRMQLVQLGNECHGYAKIELRMPMPIRLDKL